MLIEGKVHATANIDEWVWMQKRTLGSTSQGLSMTALKRRCPKSMSHEMASDICSGDKDRTRKRDKATGENIGKGKRSKD